MDYKTIREVLLKTANAREAARILNIPVHRVYYCARISKIKLRQAGRPIKHVYDPAKLLNKVKRAIKDRGGLSRLSKRLKIPYYVITNLSKKLKFAS